LLSALRKSDRRKVCMSHQADRVAPDPRLNPRPLRSSLTTIPVE
jgi:hypothetical protein